MIVADNVTAQDLMRMSFLRLGQGHTLREALGVLRDPLATYHGPHTLLVLDSEGALAGMLTIRYLLKALLGDWVAEQKGLAGGFDEVAMIHAVEKNLSRPLSDAMIGDIPTASPDDRLLTLMERVADKRLDCIPVVSEEGGRVLGVLYLTDIFNAAAQLALATDAGPSSPGGAPSASS